MKKFCESLREHPKEITNFKKKKNEVINQRAAEIIWKCKICYICKENLENKHAQDKKYHKVNDHCHYTGEYRGGAHSICNLKFSVPKQVSIVFHNGSNYDHHFFIIKLAKTFKGQFTCLGKNTEQYMIFTVPIKKRYKNW